MRSPRRDACEHHRGQRHGQKCALTSKNESEFVLTLDLERTPLEPSIQTYSAMTLPPWGSLRYFSSCSLSVEAATADSLETHIGSVGEIDVVGLEEMLAGSRVIHRL